MARPIRTLVKRLLIVTGIISLGTCPISSWAATTTDKISYGTSTAITITINSLASSATVGRTSTAVVNTTNLFDDALVTVQITTGAGAAANDKAVYVYLYGSEDATNYDQEEGNAPGTDGGYTINSPTIFKGPIVINTPTASKLYIKTFSVAQFWNGVMPRKWGIIVVNFEGQTLGASGNSATYTGITYTNA